MSRTYGTATLVPSAGPKLWAFWRIVAEPHVVMKLKRTFPRIDGRQHGELRLKDTAEVCRDLQWFMTRYPLELDDESRKHLRDRSDEHRRTQAAVESVLTGAYQARTFPLALPLRDYQRVAADLTLRFGGLLLADDVGIGKTATAIGVLSDPRARPAVVVTLTHLPRQWKAEIEKFAPGTRVHIAKQGTPYDLGAGNKRRQRSLFDAAPGSMPDVLILNYAKLSGWADELAPHIRGIVFDEVQELRHAGTDKYSAAVHLAEHAAVRLGLSATPIYNYGNEMFNIVEALRPGELGSRDEFHGEWCGAVDDKGRALVSEPRAFGRYLRESGIMLRRTRKDVGRELPPVQRIPHVIDVDHKVLDEVKRGAAELARILLAQSGTGFSKMQAAQEFDLQLRQATGVAKAPYVAEFVRLLVESGETVVLYGWHHAVYDIWREQLHDLGVRFLTGRESEPQKAASLRDFTAGKAKVLVISLRAGAGIDGLQHVCRTVVNGELDWSPGVHEQGIGRVARDGQTEPVTVYDLLSDQGSDPTIADVLGIKTAQSEGMRDPNAELVEKLEVDTDRIKKLAAAYLASLETHR